MTEFVGREYSIIDVINIVEDRRNDPGYDELYLRLEAWVKSVAQALALEAGGRVEYAEVGEVLLVVPGDG